MGQALRNIRHIPGQSLTYLHNPKVASKSIEATLWKAHDPSGAPDNPHGRKEKPFLRANELTEAELQALLGSEFFTVVRNPYSRFLSAFLNKVSGRGDRSKATWHKRSARFGMSAEAHPSINDLLAAMREMPADAIDKHFRPQHLNVLNGIAPIDFLGHMERMEEVEAFLGRHGFALQANRRGATGAAGLARELLDTAARTAICEIYESDFLIFGYSEDPTISMPRPERVALSRDRSRLRALLGRRLEHA
jgi:hypothetical protein